MPASSDGRESGDQCGYLDVVRIAFDDAQRRRLAHSGIFPCFFGGSDARLVRSIRSARVIAVRVCDGSIPTP